MDSALSDLLRSNHDSNSNKVTHYTNYGPAQKWSISDSNYNDFWLKYCDLILSDEKLSKKLCLAEVSKEYMPIIVDFTLKFLPSNDDNTEYYKLDFLLSVVYCYQQIIKETLKISPNGAELYCCVLGSNHYEEDAYIIYNFRVQFPYCKTMASIQNRLIRPLVLQMFRSRNIMRRLVSQPVNDWEDIVDPLSVEKPITMYGSSTNFINPKLIILNGYGVKNHINFLPKPSISIPHSTGGQTTYPFNYDNPSNSNIRWIDAKENINLLLRT